VLAIIGFSYVTAVIANEPTPWMGAIERAAQYGTNLWYAALALVLLPKQPPVGQASDRARFESPKAEIRTPATR
jgi:hypothetical protein